MRTMSKKKGMGFIFGLGLGAGIGMLLAPKKGEELRNDLSKKISELLDKAKNIDTEDVKDNIVKKINELKDELTDLDKEKALDLAKEKALLLKEKANDLWEYTKEKGTPVLEKAASEVKNKSIQVTKEVLKKLEGNETKKVTTEK